MVVWLFPINVSIISNADSPEEGRGGVPELDG